MSNNANKDNKNILKISIVILLGAVFTLSIAFLVKSTMPNSSGSIAEITLALSKCRGAGADKCIAKNSVLIGKMETPSTGLNAAKLLLESRRDLRDGCHTLIHEIGKQFYNEFKDGAMVENNSWCSYGYYHGLMQSYGEDNLDSLITYARKLCNKVEGKLTDDCMHGIGHAAYTNLLSIPKSLAICSEISEESFASSCADGTIMEEIMKSPNGLLSSGFSVKDCIYYDNNAVVAGCAKGMSQQNVNLGLDVTQSCSHFTDETIYKSCAHGFGMSLAGNEASGSSFGTSKNQYNECGEIETCTAGYGWISYMYFLDIDKASNLCREYFREANLKSCVDTAILASKNDSNEIN
jgi:hypothetical protein